MLKSINDSGYSLCKRFQEILCIDWTRGIIKVVFLKLLYKQTYTKVMHGKSKQPVLTITRSTRTTKIFIVTSTPVRLGKLRPTQLILERATWVGRLKGRMLTAVVRTVNALAVPFMGRVRVYCGFILSFDGRESRSLLSALYHVWMLYARPRDLELKSNVTQSWLNKDCRSRGHNRLIKIKQFKGHSRYLKMDYQDFSLPDTTDVVSFLHFKPQLSNKISISRRRTQWANYGSRLVR